MKKIIIFTLLLLTSFNVAQAALVPAECAGDATLEQCNLGAAEQTVINIIEFLLGIAGSLALLMFVYGGLLYIVGGATPSYAQKGKDALKYAIIGLVVILSAGVIMKAVIDALA